MIELSALIGRLKRGNLHISTAESCTGGLLSAAFTDIPGSSEVFGWGFVCYSNHAKARILGVPEEILSNYGAVSEETAALMARGALQVSGEDIAISTTGIAGPGGETAGKQVGLVFIALADKNEVIISKNFFQGDRAAVRRQTVDKALLMLDQYLTDKEY